MRSIVHISALVLVVALFVSVNLAAGLFLRQARLDLTEHNLFTLSAGTKHILSTLDAPIEVQFYFSQSLASDYPQVRLYGQRVRDMLGEMAGLAHTPLTINAIDPAPFSDAEDAALAKGLVAQPIADDEVIYFGLVASNAAGGVETIPFFADERQEYLEYDLARLIQNLAEPQKPTIAILSNLPLDTGAGGIAAALQGTSQPFLIYNELADRFAVEFITMDVARIPARFDVLLLAHPRPLTDRQAYAVDQFIMRGGRLIAFIDPQSEVSLTAGENDAPLRGATEQSNLPRLMAQWGVAMDANQIIADRARAQKVATGTDARRLLSDYIVWLALQNEDMNAQDVVTAGIDRLHVGTVGRLVFTPHPDIKHEPLVTASADAGLLPRDFILQAPSPDALLQKFAPHTGEEKLVIAARISGAIKSAFSAPPASALVGEKNQDSVKARDHIAASAQEAQEKGGAQILLFADSDFFDDRFWVSEQIYQGQRFGVPIADNAKFLLNAVEHMVGSQALISLRGRERIERPFTRVEALRMTAQTQYRAEQDRLLLRVEAAQRELDRLERGGTGLEQAQSASVNYRRELVDARKSLRRVQGDLNRDIDRLGAQITWLNIAAVPTLLIVSAGFVGLRRRVRRRATQRNSVTQKRNQV